MLKLIGTVLCALAIASTSHALQHRSWQFHDPDWDYLQKAIPMAKSAGMNRIQLSHRIIMDAEQLWSGKDHEERLELVRKSIALAHEHDLKVDMWTHELSGVPNEFIEGGKAKLSPELWEWLRQKYEKVFELLPDLDGLVLTFAETDFSVYKNNKTISDDSQPRRIVKLIDVLSGVCAKKGRELLVRTFVYEPHEVQWMEEVLKLVSAELGDRKNITIMTKCVPHDWTPYYPYNPLLGKTSGLPQVVEIDLGQEFTGQSKILHCEVDYVHRVLAHARDKDVVGAVARVERMDNYALGTPNEVNIFAFSKLINDSEESTEELWNEWGTERYGEKAASHVISALKRTFDITNLTFFPLEQWIVNHSKIPSWGYAYSHITSRQNAKWSPSPKNESARDELLKPTQDTLTRITAEKDLARELSEQSLNDLEKARENLKQEDYEELLAYLELGRDNVEVFFHQNMAMFGFLALKNQNKIDSESETARQLRTRTESHVLELREWADVMEKRYGADVWPGNPQRIREFAESVEERLD